jgi:hypothetical protein
MATDQTEHRVTEQVECNTYRLYSGVAEAIAYLNEIATQYAGTDIHLADGVDSYDVPYVCFEYTREETDAERSERLEKERQKAEEEALVKAKAAAIMAKVPPFKFVWTENPDGTLDMQHQREAK